MDYYTVSIPDERLKLFIQLVQAFNLQGERERPMPWEQFAQNCQRFGIELPTDRTPERGTRKISLVPTEARMIESFFVLEFSKARP